MVELVDNELVFSFPEVHPQARLTVSLERTFSIPEHSVLQDDFTSPASIGSADIEHVDDFASSVPDEWVKRGGVMVPINKSEAVRIKFHSDNLQEHDARYPFAVKIAAGKINAVTGEQWTNSLSENRQDYVIIPSQSRLDGYCVEQNIIRQFVATSTGEGYSAEGQLTEREEFGGLQISAYPMKRDAFENRWPKIVREPSVDSETHEMPMYLRHKPEKIALALGGKLKQGIYKDSYEFSDWDIDISSRCFVHLVNAENWKELTGKEPPANTTVSDRYAQEGYPFNDQMDHKTLSGSTILSKIKNLASLSFGKRSKQ